MDAIDRRRRVGHVHGKSIVIHVVYQPFPFNLGNDVRLFVHRHSWIVAVDLRIIPSSFDCSMNVVIFRAQFCIERKDSH